MSTGVEHRQPDQTVDSLAALLDRATDPAEVEVVACRLGATGNNRAVRPLLEHLGDRQVQSDGAAEDAVCRALMTLGVMQSYGHHAFSLRSRQFLDDDVVETIRDLSAAIPWQYFGTRRI